MRELIRPRSERDIVRASAAGGTVGAALGVLHDGIDSVIFRTKVGLHELRIEGSRSEARRKQAALLRRLLRICHDYVDAALENGLGDERTHAQLATVAIQLGVHTMSDELGVPSARTLAYVERILWALSVDFARAARRAVSGSTQQAAASRLASSLREAARHLHDLASVSDVSRDANVPSAALAPAPSARLFAAHAPPLLLETESIREHVAA